LRPFGFSNGAQFCIRPDANEHIASYRNNHTSLRLVRKRFYAGFASIIEIVQVKIMTSMRDSRNWMQRPRRICPLI
jgi:hypothetical protein